MTVREAQAYCTAYTKKSGSNFYYSFLFLPKSKRDAMYTVQDFYVSHVIEIPLFYWKNAYLVNPKLHNIVGNLTTSEVFGNVDDIWSEGQ